ncbi:LEAF RUST 10 DISEASE-RESISTANCE LOCUS RECEPTOR-LIKE PROTEIN KINASE-like 2.7 [Neltuma alba]|uniref:LEAF RUST 10 DISEASE-RESISTANCE LOCUS RECEPTOR-LIKE PROTEIN KINASE-like 2.7 n=1 Tax=Neltuma alba TaxID=207710 RepID=UPI0010A4322F|nr:LEAF RUST 10 DISEASE-RESISTANCE LOCUS RECEPTOR-LIKE PROTEIN KINASE-like 2.7 [Prosopis alba]
MEAHVQFLTFFVFLSSFPLSLSQPGMEHWECGPSPCGKVRNIDYPFWSDKSYCGRPGFQLDCPQDEDNFPSIHIDSQTFNVTQIDSSTYRMTLVRTDFVYDNCSSFPTNTSVSTPLNLFHYDEPSVKNVTLFYHCSEESAGEVQFPCHPWTSSNSNSRNYAFYSEDVHTDMPFQHGLDKCKHRIQVPLSIESHGYTRHKIQALQEALGKGFRVQYDVDRSCGKCWESHGICGSNDTSPFICYCPDGHHPLNCSVSSLLRSFQFSR